MLESGAVPERLVLSGYYGFGNVGDDALLEALAPACLAAGVRELLVPAGDAARVSHVPGVTPLGRNDLRAIGAALRGAAGIGAALFSGGGGLLQDATSLRSLAYYLGLVALARRRRAPYAIGFQSIGPLRRRLSRRAVRWAADGAAAVTVRDTRSRDTLVELGVSAERVTVSADPVFLLPPPTAEELAAAEAELPPRPRVGLCLRPTANAPVVAAAVAAWLKRRAAGTQVVLLACQDVDHALHQDIAAHAPADAVRPPAAVRATLAAVGACDALVSERLHPLVFAALAGVPGAAIDYDPKVAGLAADLGLPVVARDDDLTPERLEAAVAERLGSDGEGGRLRAEAAAAAERVGADLRCVLAALAAASGDGERTRAGAYRV